MDELETSNIFIAHATADRTIDWVFKPVGADTKDVALVYINAFLNQVRDAVNEVVVKKLGSSIPPSLTVS
jgi:hypothetical protein